jgi:hypothetical protein
MQHVEDLELVEMGSFPARSSRLTGASRLSTIVVLPAQLGREAAARAALEEIAEQWALPRFRSRRWLLAADDALGGPQPLEMFVQVDCFTNLLTLELWAYGKVVFGIDDWLGI